MFDGSRRTLSRRSAAVALGLIVLVASAVPPSGGSVAAADAGLALQLNGSSQYVRLGAAPGLGATSFTIETWFKRTGTGVGASTGSGGISSAIPLVTKGRGQADGSNLDMNYFLGISASSGRLVADFEEGASGASPGLNHPITGTTVVTSNVWHHAAATYDGTWRLYLDGVLDGTLAVNQPPRADSIQQAALGSALTSTGTAAGFFAGVIDEARIWNVARTASQIAATRDVALATATSGLLGRWALDESSGSTAAESSGTANVNGTVIGSPTRVAGFPLPGSPPPPSSNLALQLNGSSQYVRLGAAPGLGATSFTIETWFKRTGTGVGASTGSGGISSAIPLVTKGRGQADGSNLDMNYFLGISASSGRLVADFEEGASGASPGLNHPITGTTVVTSNVWHHAAATYDGTWRLYLDGVLDGTLAVNQPPRADSIQQAALGSALTSTGTAAGFFAGVIDEARIWNVARTASQIAATRDVALATATSGLLGRWALDESSGSTAAESSGTANVNGTVIGSPTRVAGFVPSGGPPNLPPTVSLGSPGSGVTGTDTNPVLSATPSDPEGAGLTVSFYGRAAASGDFALIGSVAGVPSGTSTNVTWAGRSDGQRYEWYATANDGMSSQTAATRSFTTAAGADPVLVGAGDIARCLNPGNTGTATAAVVDGVLGTVFTAGDDVYENRTLAEFTNCYDPSWGGPGGSIKSRTRPAAGNHEWNTGNLNGYFAYYGAQAGGNSYYSYDLGASWHVVVLDSECAKVAGGCGSTSPQVDWLRADLAANATKNVVAVFHKPRFTSATRGGATETQPFWDVLYQFRAEIILVGHEHHYERFVPMSAAGVSTPTTGIRQFVVGTGGASHTGFGTVLGTSAVRDATTFGVLKLTLRPSSYDWTFLPVAGGTFTDSGTSAVVPNP